MKTEIRAYINEYVSGLKERFGEELCGIILYGSYARGDYRDDSDIDIMILTSLDDDKIASFRLELYDFTYEFNESHNTLIMPVTADRDLFERRAGYYPFYGNIIKEGVELYAS